VTANGRREKAYGQLLPVEEINEHIIMSGGNAVPFGVEDPNQPPTIAIAPVTRASLRAPVTLTATVTVTDDGLPKARASAARPATPAKSGDIPRQTNSVTAARPRGLTVSWYEYAGPAKVTFEPAGAIPVTNGTAATTARFEKPGTYTLVVTARDGQLAQRTDVVVTIP
jgi:hypothetical protein